jgi:hypothetical protein
MKSLPFKKGRRPKPTPYPDNRAARPLWQSVKIARNVTKEIEKLLTGFDLVSCQQQER